MAPPAPVRRDPLVPLLILLSATTGLIDAVSVLGLGKVFTANMTGNVVFLGFALAGVPGFAWPLYLTALGFFAAGAAIAGRICKAHEGRGHRHWLLVMATLEAGLLLIAAACALDYDYRSATPSWALCAMIALTAAAMGSRNATIRQLKVPDLTTTVLTLTVTGIAADSSLAGGANPNLGRRVAAILAILAGALIGALLLRWGGLVAPLLLAAAADFGATFLLVRNEAPQAH
ncbi:hypothetical protein CLG96_11695 [Sphingomonas oleivorans]|uniref:DUF1275 family protein n=1 Tax=Sphingomonas oleivorans TaxID=1735121 RepID=A0A2T5FVM2_9SPHN|nr:YoaK family protein [Sphingomonas oleivorans]PTQ09831.1 hypothetical protein CLG96_11695 [Sphingomonas oleivorans]